MDSKKRLLLVTLLVVLGAVAFYALYGGRSNEWHQSSEEIARQASRQGSVWPDLAATKAVQDRYKLKKAKSLMGFHVTHLEDRRHPQEFVIIEGLPRQSTELIFGEAMDMEMIESMANVLLSLRHGPEPLRLTIQKFETLDREPLTLDRHSLDHRRIAARIKLSTEKKTSRDYKGDLIRYCPLDFGADDARRAGRTCYETLMVSFSRPETYQPGLAGELLRLQMRQTP